LLAAEIDSQRATFASNLAFCGHVYLDLGMPDRAKRCFDLVDQAEPGYVLAETLNHLAETDMKGALQKAAAELKHNPHWFLYWVIGGIHYNQHKYALAKQDLEAGLAPMPFT
jgi:hypothetical protein